MQKNDIWLLPEGIDEVLPEQAEKLERLRAKLLAAFKCWGYRLVIPPFVDYSGFTAGWRWSRSGLANL